MQTHAIFSNFSSSESWSILSDIERSIKTKIESIGIPLKDWDIQINYGIKTGFNDAFIIDSAKRNEILNACQCEDERQRTAELIRPILRGRDIKRYGYEWADLWIINTHNGVKGRIPRIRIEDYPAVKAHIDQFWDKIKDRTDQGDTPYNLRNCAYLDDFSRPKILWKRVGSIIRFSYDEEGLLGLDSTCFATGKHIQYLCCVLNSSMGHYLLNSAPRTGTGDLLISVQAVNPIRVPVINDGDEVFKELVGQFVSNPSSELDEKIDNIIFDLYGLNPDEREYIVNNYR